MVADSRTERRPFAGDDVLARSPALARLASDRRRVPIVRQMTATECGAACVAMVLAHHGRYVSLEQVRSAAGVGRDGASATAILETARRFGLVGRGLRLEVEDLALLPRGAILHWEFNHWVVLESMGRGFVDVVDPAFGRRRIDLATVGRSFTGVALTFERASDFEERKAPARGMGRYVDLMRGSGVVGRVLVVSLALQVFALGAPLATSAVVDRVLPRHDFTLLGVLGIGALGVAVFYALASLVRGHLLVALRTHVDARLTLGLLDHLASLPYAYFQRRTTGDLMMRVNSSAVVRETLTAGALSALIDGGLLLVYLGLLAFVSPTLTLIVALLGAAQVLVVLVTARAQERLVARHLDVQARADGQLLEVLTGMETLKAMGAEQGAVTQWSNAFVDVLNASMERSRLTSFVDSFHAAFRLVAPLVVLGFGADRVLRGQMTIGLMFAAVALAGALLAPLGQLVGVGTQLVLLRGYLDRLDDVLDAEPEQPHGDARVKPASVLRGAVRLEGVGLRYSPTGPWVVRNANLTIEPGQFVAIVGRSGSGKTSLASMLLGLHAPTTGSVHYDEQRLVDLDLRSVRRQLGIVLQRPHLFGASIRNNIAALDPTIPLSAVRDCARLACIDDDIEAMPMGYETILPDGGASLSGGQRQRIALARALAQSPAILLLDEATSALDAVSEARIKKNLAELDCTRIVVAHRLSTVREADVIVVMDEGRIVETGKHEELVAKGGVYARLVGAQLEDKNS